MKALKLPIVTLVILAFSFTCQNAFAAKASKKSKTSQAKEISVGEKAEYPENFLNFMQEAKNLVEKKDFTSAMNLFKSENYKENLYSSYSDKTSRYVTVGSINRSKASLKNIKGLLEDYEKIQGDFTQAALEFTSFAKADDFENAKKCLEEKKAAFGDFANLLKKVSEECESLKETYAASLDYYSGKVDVTYPLLIYKFAGGFEGENLTGILGLLTSQWDYTLGEMKKVLFEKCRTDSVNLSKILTSENISSQTFSLSQTEGILKRTESASALLKNISDFYSLCGKKIKSRDYENYSDYSKSADFLTSLSKESSLLLKTALEFAEAKKTSSQTKLPSSSVEEIRSAASDFAKKQAELAAIFSQDSRNATAQKNYSWFTSYISFKDEFKNWDELRTSYLSLCNYIINNGSQEAAKVWIRISTWFTECGKSLLTEDKKELSVIEGLLTRPEKALSKIQEYEKIVRDDIGILQKLDTSLNEGYAFRANFQDQRNLLKNQITQMQEYIGTSQGYAKTANENSNTSLLAANQVDIYYNRATLNFNSKNFSQAHTNYDRASQTYNDLIEDLKKDLDRQEKTYQKLLDLRQDFIEKERPIIVAEVRNYINQAKNAYYSGNFEEANSLLTKAESRRSEWAKLMDTELEANEELQRIKEMVNTAISIKEGRVIYPEDPLYPEMSQLLQIAQHYYNEALEAKNKSDEKDLLSKAKNKVNEVKTIYPRNQAANILSLKIDQRLDPTAFNTMFAEKVTSLKKINYSAKDSTASEAYNDLLDLYEINPNYAGLKNLITSVEMDLGIRARPIAQVDYSQAQSLAKEAQALLNKAGRDENMLNQAKAKANAALAINENNALAIQVLDEISMRSGGRSAVTLSAADEELYQSAVRDLQNDNVFAAKQKVDSLLQKETNRRSAKIIKLQKRIEALL